jgi:hypothetical protein
VVGGDARALEIRRACRVWERRGPFGVVVAGAGTDDPVTLDGTGVAVWDALDRPRRLDDVVADLAGRFGVEEAAVRSDVVRLVGRLLDLHVLESA